MTTIRPNLYPQTPQRPSSQDTGKAAAQRAFFDALSQARAPTQATATAAPATVAQTVTRAPTPVQRTETTAPEQPTRLLRPGSLFDIRV